MAFGLLFLCLVINITHSQKGQYSFEAYVSTNVFEQSSDTDDEIFFRLCAGSNCGLFMSDPAGLVCSMQLAFKSKLNKQYINTNIMYRMAK